ncbi:hypothetical protein [Rhizobium leguminosarum]|uniref:Uncharacterized protein n=1 Tax=Rhizobium leguminosarum TaxID=384 RepID=A0A1B1CHR1_RHILE|nr:hypothetical protein [Rhizobium leguminosarum]ANP89281.1 hypothetical protein BA011_26220 [Rhizobium leguminosarum]ANP91660.1 hypothetical protein BA011_36850 [Rhizobium leguminosarum]
MVKQVIEYAGVPVGIVVPDKDLLKFIAVKFHVHDLDGQHFASPSDVLRAIHKLMSASRTNVPRAA